MTTASATGASPSGQGSLDAEFAAISELWSPRVVASANGQFVKIAKVEGEFVWHSHAEEDEFFLVRKGTFVLRYRDGEVVLREGDFHVVARGREHCPYTIGGEAWILFVEPVATKHTGEVVTDRTRSIETQTAHRA